MFFYDRVQLLEIDLLITDEFLQFLELFTESTLFMVFTVKFQKLFSLCLWLGEHNSYSAWGPGMY